ncbi:MAG: BREX-6 system BrxE protein [Cyanobacteria bacterium P01_G01_bin.54]
MHGFLPGVEFVEGHENGLFPISVGVGDLMTRLFPKTHKWSGLEIVRQAAIACDMQQRNRIAQSDTVRTLFYWGFAIDEQLTDRLRDHKVRRRSPQDILSFPLSAEFEQEHFTRWGSAHAEINYETEPNGRLVRLPSLHFQRVGDVQEWGWCYRDLTSWALATLSLNGQEATV